MSSISEQGNATETFCMKNALKSALKLQKVIQKTELMRRTHKTRQQQGLRLFGMLDFYPPLKARACC